MNVNFYNRIQQLKNGGAASVNPGALAPQQPSANKPDISYIVYYSLASAMKVTFGGAKLEADGDDIILNFGKISQLDTRATYMRVMQRFLYILQLNHINYTVDQTSATIRVHTNPPDPRLNIPNPQDFIQEFVFIPQEHESYVKLTTDDSHKDTINLIIKYIKENEKSV